jgi:hypothetical protein
MKVLSFTLTEAFFAAGSSCAMAAPARQNDPTIRGRTKNLAITVIVLFISFSFEACRNKSGI